MKSPAHLARVRSLGCIICGSPASAHHVRKHGSPADDYLTIPLCPMHHQHGGHGVAIHAGRRTWEKKYGNPVSMIAETYDKLNEPMPDSARRFVEEWR